MNLKNKKILVGITGGIAAYKACELIRILIKTGAEVKAVLTPNAKNFVTETTLKTLTKNPVYIEQFDEFDWKPEHISLSDEADLFIIVPASANTIGKIANGICDNLLTSIVSAFENPIVIAPAMNTKMWKNQFVQENISKIKKSGIHIIYPEQGELACGYGGDGRLADIDKIFNQICKFFQDKEILKGKKILITAGGTKEPIDPIRYIGNRSSGKMGIALAEAAKNYGAEICLIQSETAQEMLDEVIKKFPAYDMLIMAAAVADYRVENVSENKIKKNQTEKITLELVKNPDIISEASKIKTSSQIIVGFCAETENLVENAINKLERKNLDFIVANDVSNSEIGFESDYNAVTIIDKKNKNVKITDKLPKTEIAKIIMNYLLKI